MPNPVSFLHWLHQTYTNAWKGVVDITTVPAEDHAPKNSHWLSTITASGAVVKKDGKNHTLQPITAAGDARSKKGAEHAAAEAIYRQLVAEGWWDPEAAPKPKKAGMSRAQRFITDSVPCNQHNPRAYLDVSIGGHPVGRVVLELFRYKKGDTTELHAPMAVENFLAFCKGVDVGGRALSYVGCPFTRVVRRFVVQAGDVVNKDGTGGAHIHSSCGEHFPDEGLDDKNYRHTYPFSLSCANLGLEDTNSSQFFITLAPASSLDGHHTCFGKVLRGYSTIKEIEHVHMLYTSCGRAEGAPEAPPVPVVITAAGELPPGTVLGNSNAPIFSGGGYPMWAEDQGPPPEGVREAAHRLDISAQLKAQGNDAYRQGDYATALRRYRQAYQYLSWTTFKHRTGDGDVDLTHEEQDAIWQAEGVLLGNIVAAQVKLGQFAAAVWETSPDLIRKASDNPKTYLRMAQARIGLGPGEYDHAATLLDTALAKAREVGARTADIVTELRHVRELRRAHNAKLRAAFSSAFNAGLLHHPADDTPAAASAGASSRLSAAGCTWRGLPVAGGPVGPNHVLEDAGQPVLVEDAWGVHPLLVDEGVGGEEEDAGPQQQQRRQLTELLLRQARLHNTERYGPPAAAAAEGGQPLFGFRNGVESGVAEGDSWGGVGGLDAAVDAEEASGGQWWREDEGSQVGESDDGEHHPQQQQQGVGADNAPEGEVLSEEQPHQPTEQQQQLRGQQQQQAADSSSHANGSTSSLEAGPAAAVQHRLGMDGATAAEQGYDAAASDAGSDEVGLPECVDAAEQVAVMVSDSSGVKQGGYGWKPEAMPRWTHLH